VKTAKEKVTKYFGAIPPGPPVAHQSAWIAKMTGMHRQVMQDRVPQARLMKVWNVPPSFTADLDLLDLVSDVFGAGKTSRLHKRLVYQDQIATDAQAFLDPREISSQFYIQATARPGVDLKRVEQAVDEELKKFLEQGPTAEELERVRTRYFANFLRGVERVGGFGGKSDVLARGQVFAGDPAAYKQSLDRAAKATAADLKAAANRWLADGVYVLEVHPFPQLKKAPTDADRSKAPETGTPPELKLPPMERITLSNGLKVVLAQRHELPMVNFRLLVDSGYAADPAGLPGTAKLAMNMLDEGTKSRNALEISDQLDRLGAALGAGANLDQCQVSVSALKSKLDPTLELFADVVLNPSFPAADFAREQKQLLAAIQREKSQPASIAMRVLPGLIYGKDHPYGNPLTGSGTETSVSKITREGLAQFHQTWFKPNNATLIVAGDTTLAELKPKLEQLFAGWKTGEAPRRAISQVEQRPGRSVYLIDRPGALQSVIIAGHVAPPKSNPNEIAIETMNNVLGGAFVSRLNMNLREDKHWAYGASTFLVDAKGQRPFMAFAPVQTDKTKESMVEMDKELREIIRQRPVSGEELGFAQDNQTLTLPGSRETLNSLVNSMAEITRFGLADDYFQTYSGKVRALKREDLSAAAEQVLRPDHTIWVVVGDRAKIEQGIRDLKFADVQILDASSN
jgi:zinc protease